MANLFQDLTNSETWVLSQKLMSGAITADEVLGAGAHEMTMELYDSVGEVQAARKTPGGRQ